MTLDEAIELTEIRKKMVQAQCEDCWSEDAEIGLNCMYIVKELIRCKDCRYWMNNPYRESSVFGLCFKHKDIAIATDETDWCSWAERKEE